MRYFWIAISVIGVLLVAFLVLTLVRRIKTVKICRSIVQEACSCREKTTKILSVIFRKGSLMTSLLLPLENGTSIGCENVLVCHGGVNVISSSDFIGSIDDPIEGSWTGYSNGQTVLLGNLIEENRARLRAIELILRREKIDNVPLHNTVVFPSKETKLKYRRDEIIRIGQLHSKMYDMNKNRFLSSAEIKKVTAALKKNSIVQGTTEGA